MFKATACRFLKFTIRKIPCLKWDNFKTGQVIWSQGLERKGRDLQGGDGYVMDEYGK